MTRELSSTNQLMDSIPSTQPLEYTGAVSIATAPAGMALHTDTASSVATTSTMRLDAAQHSSAWPAPSSVLTPTSPAQQQSHCSTQHPVPDHFVPFLPTAPTPSEEAPKATFATYSIEELPGPYRSGPDAPTDPDSMQRGGKGGVPVPVTTATPPVPHSGASQFANSYRHAVDSKAPMGAQPGCRGGAAEATSGSVNRTIQSYASAALPQLPPDPKNPLVYSQAVFNEQDEFVDNTGKYKLVMKGSYAAVEVSLVPGESVKAEAGGMVSMSTNVGLETKMEGTAVEALTRCCCSGESMFLTHYSLKPGEVRGDLLLAPALPGHIMMLHVTEEQPWALQKSAYMASDPTVTVSSKTQTIANACCSGEGLFVLKVGGHGRLCANSYGGIMRYILRKGEERTIDNAYLVAWYEQMAMRIETAGGSLGKSFLSGEGFVVTFTGPGIVYVQTRSPGMFKQW